MVREFPSDRPLNTAAISPIMNHLIIGGGQEAISVTTTAAAMGHFEVDFLHMVTSEFLGSVKVKIDFPQIMFYVLCECWCVGACVCVCV